MTWITNLKTKDIKQEIKIYDKCLAGFKHPITRDEWKAEYDRLLEIRTALGVELALRG